MRARGTYFPSKTEVLFGGREICSRPDYWARREEMRVRQGELCALCGFWLAPDEATFEHERSRGSGSAYRDDRIVVDGEWRNAATHMTCNQAKGSKRYEWRNGKFVPRSK